MRLRICWPIATDIRHILISVILRAVALLPTLRYPNLILMSAHQDSFVWRLATTRII